MRSTAQAQCDHNERTGVHYLIRDASSSAAQCETSGAKRPARNAWRETPGPWLRAVAQSLLWGHFCTSQGIFSAVVSEVLRQSSECRRCRRRGVWTSEVAGLPG